MKLLSSHSPSAKSNLQDLLQVHFIQEALFQLSKPGAPYTTLLVVNHQDRYLSLSNEKHYLAVLTETSPALLTQVQEDLSYIQQRQKTIVHLQKQTDHTSQPAFRRISIPQIRQQAEQNGVPTKNLYLLLLEQVFKA